MDCNQLQQMYCATVIAFRGSILLQVSGVANKYKNVSERKQITDPFLRSLNFILKFEIVLVSVCAW